MNLLDGKGKRICFLYPHPDYHYMRTKTHRSYCLESIIEDIKEILDAISPLIVVCNDEDDHIVHRLVSMAFDEAFRQSKIREKAVVLKGFSYSTSWVAPRDFYRSNIHQTVLKQGSTVRDYRWKARIRFPISKEGARRFLFSNSVHKALRQHKTQLARANANSVINGDKVYWLKYVGPHGKQERFAVSKENKMKKHAYLIMAHNDYPILIELLKALDDERNDILLHMDKKSKDVPFGAIRNAVRYARLIQVPRMDVAWGGYSQIECELRLLQEAKALGSHAYYHMMTGATYLMKTMDEIVDFFERHQGYEFIGFDNSKDFSNRVTRYHFFNEIGKVSTPVDRGKILLRNKLVGLQKKMNIFYKPSKSIIYKKGCVYWSLTDEAVTYVLHRTNEIRRIYKWSLCGDEVFMHTCLYNSPFREYIFNLEHEYDSCLRYIKPSVSWNSDFSGISSDSAGLEKNTITKTDVDMCLSSGRLFALKFSGERGLEAIRDIKERLEVHRQEKI